MESSLLVMVATTVVAFTLIGVVVWRQQKKQKPQKRSLKEMAIPTKWTKVGEVGELIMYPLKGAKRQCVSEAECTKLGLKEIVQSPKLALQDRVFVVFDEKNKYMNVKKNTKMLFVETTAVDESSVKFSFPEGDDLVVNIPNTMTTLNQIDFTFGEVVGTVDCGEEAARWFSERLLGKPKGLRLGCFVKSLIPPRSINGAYDKHIEVYTKLHSDYLGAYADIASYMLMSEESINDLNSRLENPVTEHNFRPNIMVKNSPAYSEDDWDWIKLGDQVVLRGFKYCTRCVVTTVNADTGKRDPKVEPLRTLRTYRQVKEPELKKLEGNQPVMGMYAGCHQAGTVRVGDPVYINAK